MNPKASKLLMEMPARFVIQKYFPGFQAFPETLRVFSPRFLCFFCAMTILPCGMSACAGETHGRFRITGYLPEYRFNSLNLEQAALLTDLILFAAEPGPDGIVQMGRVSRAPWEELWSLREQHQTRLILCLGGWERSTRFSEVVQDPQKRARLVKSVTDVLMDRKLNGLDIDWEYPQSPADWKGYIRLLQQFQKAFSSRQLSLSITIAPGRDLPEDAWKAVDFIQLMSYDYGQQHSTLKQARQDIQTFLGRNIPAEKIILGVPFYGRNVSDRKAMTYARIVDRFQPAETVDEVDGIYFNNLQTIRQKTAAALEAGLGGVMIWEIGQDTANETSLLKAIADTVQTCQVRGRLPVRGELPVHDELPTGTP